MLFLFVHAEDEGDVAALDLHVCLNGVVHLDSILEHVVGEVLHFAKVAAFGGDGAVCPDGVILPVAIRSLEVLVVEHVARLVGSHLEVVVGGGLIDLSVVVLTCADHTEAEVAVARVDEREVCLVVAAQIGVGMLAIVTDDNLRNEPMDGRATSCRRCPR